MSKDGITVLSLCDGISGAQVALERAGIKVKQYYASEVDKHAIAVTQHNYPKTIQLGDIHDYKEWKLPKIDLIIAGFPCQSFSFSGKGLNFKDKRGQLFFKVVECIGEFRPKYFLVENVVMKKEHQDVISDQLGVQPVQISSSLLTAQNRTRNYWLGKVQPRTFGVDWDVEQIEVTQPKDKGITLLNILEDIEFKNPAAIRGRRLNPGTIVGRRLDSSGKRQDYDKKIPISQCLEVRATNTDKSNCLTTVDKDNVLTPLPIGRHVDAFKNKLPFRYYTTTEIHRLQTFPDNYCTGIVSDSQARKLLGNSFTVDIVAHLLKFLNF
jgi:DNA (cytosine-5)-methyltransferase 3A